MGCSYFFFFKQKTAYEMRISDWSSDVCSSDLTDLGRPRDCYRQQELLELESAALAGAESHGRAFRGNHGHPAPAGDQGEDPGPFAGRQGAGAHPWRSAGLGRSAEHTYELQSLMRSSYAGLCLKTKKNH